jgi:hypothetical protein
MRPVMSVERWPVCQHRECNEAAGLNPVAVVRPNDSGPGSSCDVIWLCAPHRAAHAARPLDLQRVIGDVRYAPFEPQA